MKENFTFFINHFPLSKGWKLSYTKFKYILALCFISIFIYSCVPAPKFTTRSGEAHENENKESKDENYRNPPNLISVTGIASYYADEFDGRVTYSGEVYNMYGLSAAHPEYPMGTKLRVTNLSNLKSIDLIVNDRMPYNPNRIIDLSYGAAVKLGMVKDGLAEVKIEVLKWGTGKR